jgi:hypothetical protein
MSAQTNKPTGWVGWIYFASLMMMLSGGFQAIAGLVGIFKDNFYVVTQTHLIAFSLQTWGWINLIMGIIIFLAGLELLRSAVWARLLAIFLAAISLFANMAYLNAYPFWSILIIVVDIFVIYALTVHGDETRYDV